MYEKKIAKNKRVMFYKNGKLISVKDIPEVDRYMLEGLTREQAEELEKANHPLQTVDAEGDVPSQLKQGKVCIFCSEVATTSKYINGKTADLCNNDYYSRTTGEVAAQLRTHGLSQHKDQRGETATL